MPQDCPFCQINTQATRILWEDDLTVTFLSNPRLLPGHTLVVPKRHVEQPWELTPEELQAIFKNLWKVEHILLNAGLATGCDIRQNYRPFMKQGRVKVDHMHFHVLPRTFKDALYETSMQFEDFVDLPDAERAKMAKIFAQ